ncbi:hypothetical protein [Tardiphaga sp. 841_E9_N1_2]|jgi:hypothetical protein|uniref:hypothetical protein n=1 Tax=Tardiphaga sp. 841_E9_N1_2 TaxID=3240762 RepID=UPI003F28CA28
MRTATPRQSCHALRAACTFALAFAIAGLSVAPSHAQAKKTKAASADSTYSIREKCIAKAQAAYPDNGLGTATVMTQRTGIYADCARSNGIRP